MSATPLLLLVVLLSIQLTAHIVRSAPVHPDADADADAVFKQFLTQPGTQQQKQQMFALAGENGRLAGAGGKRRMFDTLASLLAMNKRTRDNVSIWDIQFIKLIIWKALEDTVRSDRSRKGNPPLPPKNFLKIDGIKKWA